VVEVAWGDDEPGIWIDAAVVCSCPSMPSQRSCLATLSQMW
jgi:hypothetical protein